MMKVCTGKYGCGQTKPLWDFYILGTKKDGEPRYQTHCKECDNKRRSVDVAATEYNQTPTVYMLINLATLEFYIGSTTRTLRKRWWSHKTSAFKSNVQSQLYHCMRCYNDDRYWEMIPLREMPGASKDELREAEQEAIDELNPALNMIAAVKECK
jgi:hypothetical protein